MSTVLFLAANPLQTRRLQLDVECRTIEESISAAKFRDHIRFRSRWALRPGDLLRALNEDAPLVLHFSGHGTGDDGICLESEDGNPVHVSADALAQVMRSAGASVMLVVLNACYSDVQAQALIAHVPCVVGISGAIGDEAAIVYAGSFYGALAFGQSVGNAHQQGLAALALGPGDQPPRDIRVLEAPPGTLAPTLLTRSDVDANCVYIVHVPRAVALKMEGLAAVHAGAPYIRQGSGSAVVQADEPGPRRHSTVRSTEGEPRFTGRDDELRAIEEMLVGGRVVVLHGAPGIGKTRLALEYAHRQVDAYPGGMVFVPFDHPPPMELARLLRDLGKPVYPDESIEDQCRRALRGLGGDGRTLLIYDAVADERTLRAWLPYGGLDWHLIATSTSARWAGSWSTLEVGGLRVPDACALVSAMLADEAAAVELAESIVANAAGITVELCASANATRERFRRGRPMGDLRFELAEETIASLEASWGLLSHDAQLVLRFASACKVSPVSAARLVSALQRIHLSRANVEAAIDEVCDRQLAILDSDRMDVNPVTARFVCARKPLLEAEIRALRRDIMEIAGSPLGVSIAPSDRGSPAVGTHQVPQTAHEPCFDLASFADGELEAERAQAFRSHLPTCVPCQAGLLEAVQLDARLSTLSPDGLLPVSPSVPSTTSPPIPRPVPATPPPVRRRRLAAWVGGALAPIAAMAAYLIYLFGGRVPPNAFAELKARPYDIRLAYADAAAYRPAREQMRGAGGPASESIPYDALGAFQKHHDGHALAIAQAINGEKLTEVAAQLGALPQTPAIRSDRAAIELLTTSNDNAEPILTELEALEASDDLAVARAARWNYALLLSQLQLPLSAAAAFRAIAADNEPGWAYEAGQRAEREERRGNLQQAWERAYQASKALLNTGTPVPTTVVQGAPGVMRAQFYNAVRAAQNPERVLALGSMAAELDRLGGQPLLSNYVARVAKLDFRRRAPLARSYARLLGQRASLTPEDRRDLITPDPSRYPPDDVFDIVMGAMVELDVVPDHLEAFRRMAKQAGDPWFEIILAVAEATVDRQHGNWLEAEARLRKAEELCTPAVMYQCLARAHQLAVLYEDLRRVPEAIKTLDKAVGAASSAGEWRKYRQLLWRLADIERFSSKTATARAYANEVLVMANGCDYGSQVYRTLTAAAVLDVDGRAARRSLEAAQRCGPPNLVTATYLADIGRLDPQPDDLPRLQGWLNTLRAGPLTPAQRVLADEIEGRLLVEHDRAAGKALLQRAIAAADALPHEAEAARARAGAYSVLVFDAARHADHARAFAWIAEELGFSTPRACAVGIAAEDERAVVVVRGARGDDVATYDPARGPRAPAPAVPAELAKTLDGCAHVQVMAQAALQGQPHVLPDSLPWSYATAAQASDSPHGPAPIEAQGLVVTDVTPPADLKLPTLSGQIPATSSTVLSGPAATLTRVLARMRDATEIQFHTHALVDTGISDASYLVLSPEPEGRYALTAEAIRGVELRGRPIVVLAACHSAQGALYQRTPWSLPDAFLAKGARAVFAAATDIPDRDSGAFFTRVLARVRSGADPARALRDERMVALASNPSSWVADVILFE